MFPLKKILCPTDFSEPSFEGLRAAGELAQAFSAELLLVHVVPPLQAVTAAGVPVGYSVQDYYKEMAEEARKSLDAVVATRVPKGTVVRTKVTGGQPSDEIVREAEAEQVDLIVIATHGWTGWRRFIFGSVAEKVVRLSTCPVLAIPGPGGTDAGTKATRSEEARRA